MRKRKRNSKLIPYAAGLAAGYAASLAVSVLAAFILSFTDAASKTAGAAAVLAAAIGSFVCGRTAGSLKHRDGLKTGALCGLAFAVPLVIISVIFRLSEGAMFFVKVVLCVSFGTVGGVAGVNREER